MAKPGITDPLPPLEWLRVFEAAGRLSNFTAAADELNLTQAAISQRVRHLEDHLGVKLFLRLARGVELTADGQAYLPHVQAALTRLRRSTADLFGTPRRKLVIAAPASVAALWIAPRLQAVERQFPGLEIAVASVHRPADFATTKADLEVRFGRGDWPGDWPGVQGQKLYDEVLVPACAPALLHGARADDWRELPLIGLSGPRDGWLDWAAANNEELPKPPRLRFDSFITALQACLAGAGVILASRPLSQTLFDSGALMRLPGAEMQMSAGYWLLPRSSKIKYAKDGDLIAVLSQPTP